MIFVDTGAWFAAFVPNDPDHTAADDWLVTNTEPLLTTDYVVDELLTLLRIRNEYERAIIIGEHLLQERISDLHWVTQEDAQAAWEIYQQFQDKR